jgi:hypothetical protein
MAKERLMKATQYLPDQYQEQTNLDLSQDRRLMLLLNILGLILLIPWGWLFLQLFGMIRPDAGTLSIEIGGLGTLLLTMLLFLATIVLVVTLHELVHGLFFWWFTGKRPHYGTGAGYAYAAAPPGWYLPRQQYFIVALAPLFVISIVGLALLPLLPSAAFIYLFAALLFNAVGSVGDLVVVGWLLQRPPHTLVQDSGPAITIYY